MSLATNLVTLIAGLALLLFGADFFVRGAVRIATLLRVSRLLIGMTVVAFGTSAPELSLDVTATLRGAVDLAFGDLVGSNIANIGLILGVAAMVAPIEVHLRLMRVELQFVLAISAGLWAMSADGVVSRLDGSILLVGFGGFLLHLYHGARREPQTVRTEFEHAAGEGWSRSRSVLALGGGLVGLVLGAQFMVSAATAFARDWGVSELLIGLTIVAIGTSLPELATSIMAISRKELDITVGNVLGSNIFNIAFIMGTVAQILPLPVHAESLSIDLPVMLGLVVLLMLLVARRGWLTRRSGLLLVSAYVAYIVLKIVTIPAV